MKLSVLMALAAAVCSATRIPRRDYDNNHYVVVEIDTSLLLAPLKSFIHRWSDRMSFEHPVHGLDDHFVFSVSKGLPGIENWGDFRSDGVRQWKRDDSDYIELSNTPSIRLISWMEPQRRQKRMPVPWEAAEVAAVEAQPISRDASTGKEPWKPVDSSQQPIADAMAALGINDPIFPEQWHLINSRYPGNDVNITGLWEEGITGKGIVTCIVDDGLDMDLNDLKKNFNAKGSWDFNDNTELPKPRLNDDHHGTRCAGEVAAVKNDVCGVGAAYDSQVAGVRILSSSITDDQEAAAIIYGLETNDIYSCSWGPRDDGRTMGAPPMIVRKAMVKAVQEGRDGKGSVYVFALGNGGRQHDLCNFDGYTNSIYSITVGAVDYKGMHPTYSEACLAVMVVTYSSGSGEHIHTTDIHKRCSSGHGGTSAAAPLAAGIFALVLLVNPELTWRDMQYVAAMSAVPINEDDGDYQTNALGRKYSHKYGYGKIDAYQMVHFAKNWTNVKPQAWYYTDDIAVHETIIGATDSNKVIKKSVEITKEELELANFERVEQITLVVDIRSNIRGKVGARIRSPYGVVSDLATFRPSDFNTQGFRGWTFMSVAHWGESGVGKWDVEVFTEDLADGVEITFNEFQLRLFGELIDPEKAEKYDITKDYAAERQDKSKQTTTSSSNPISTSASKSTDTSETKIESENGSSSSSLTSAASNAELSSVVASSSKHIEVTPTDTSDDAPDGSDDKATESDEPADGEGKHYATDHKGQYFMALAVLGFVIVIIFMRFHKTPGSTRRRRREEYEFDIIPGEDYSDSDNENDDDSLDLGNHRRIQQEERDRVFDDFNANTLPGYEDDEMFKIGDEDEAGSKKGKDRNVDKKSEGEDDAKIVGGDVNENADESADASETQETAALIKNQEATE